MLTNCELPNCMLDRNIVLNDYDFVLYHLYLNNPTYREYYQRMRQEHPERMMILDNSAYEFSVNGQKLDMDAFVGCIKELKPDYYILPDVLGDFQATIDGVTEFIEKYHDIFRAIYMKPVNAGLPIQPLAVIQGNSYDELSTCLEYYFNLGIGYVGIPFHLPFYKELMIPDDVRDVFKRYYPDTYTSDDIRYAMGRVKWVLDNKDYLRCFSKVHFLGSHCPLEKFFYSDYKSMDTGYLVKLGIEGITLFQEKEKPNIILDHFIDKPLDTNIKDIIETNIKLFKNL